MTSFLFELSANLFDAWLGVFFVIKLNNGKVGDNIIPSTIGTLLCFAVSTIYLYISVFSFLQSVIIFGILLFCSFLVKTGTWATKILGPIIFEVTLIIIATILSFLFSYIFSMSLNDLFSIATMERYLYVICCKIIISATLMLILRFFATSLKFRLMDLILYIVAPLMTVFVLYTFMVIGLTYSLSSFFNQIIISVLGLAALNLISLLLFIKLTQTVQAKTELEVLKLQSELEQKNYAELGNLYQQLKTLRHDFKQHLIGLKQLITKKQLDDVNNYIDNTELELNKSASIIHTNNRMLDYIINAKISAHPNITFLVTGECSNLSNINEFDLASLFGNLLDNAIEEALKHDEKILEVKFFINNNYQNVICKNRISKSIIKNNPLFISTKTQKEIHGYGIKSMRKIVTEANGFIDFFEEEHHFCVHIALPIKSPVQLYEDATA